jgi:hypothetical protein
MTEAAGWDGSLRGRVVLVAGAGQTPGATIGNGRATAVLFGRAGARVLCADRNLEAAAATVEQITDEGGEAAAWQVDVTQEQAVSDMVRACLQRWGRIDVLHNNVGVSVTGGDAPITDIEYEAFSRVTAINLGSMVLTCKHVLPVMRKQGGGVICNIGSVAGVVGDGADTTTSHEVTVILTDDHDPPASGSSTFPWTIDEADGPGPFLDPVSLPTGEFTHSVLARDLTGDGRLDLVAASSGTDSAAVALNLGGGRFTEPVRYPTGPGTFPKYVEVADLDGDGVPDLITANQDSVTGVDVSVFFGRGDGTFNEAVSYPSCSRPHEVTAGDVDGDGHLDVVVACWGGDVVSVHLNQGDGTLGAGDPYQAAYGPHSLVLEDFDGDGTPDLAVVAFGDNRIAVLTGFGDGTFSPPTLYWSGLGPHNIQAADLDGDGFLDLVSTAERDDQVGVLLGRGDGTFHDPVFYGVGDAPKAAAAGDLDGDGILDLAVVNTSGNYPDGSAPTTVTILRGLGNGTFEHWFTLPAPLTPFAVAIADLDGDGRPDLAVAGWHSGDIKVFRRAG